MSTPSIYLVVIILFSIKSLHNFRSPKCIVPHLGCRSKTVLVVLKSSSIISNAISLYQFFTGHSSFLTSSTVWIMVRLCVRSVPNETTQACLSVQYFQDEFTPFGAGRSSNNSFSIIFVASDPIAVIEFKGKQLVTASFLSIINLGIIPVHTFDFFTSYVKISLFKSYLFLLSTS